jgi:hypothetical protein
MQAHLILSQNAAFDGLHLPTSLPQKQVSASSNKRGAVVDVFVARENIKHFEALLLVEADTARRPILIELLRREKITLTSVIARKYGLRPDLGEPPCE